MKGVGAAPLGAWEVASKIAKWRQLGTIAVITPVGGARSKFVRDVVQRVSSNPPLGKKWKVGPFNLQWETAQVDLIEETCRQLNLPEEDEIRVCAESLCLAGDGRAGRVREWLERQRRLFGLFEFSVATLRNAVKEIVGQGRLYSPSATRRLVAMTIHQAKNREFDRVIVLWPYEVKGSDERKRRLAYNAITRARYEAYVVVQNESRVGHSPFVPGVTSLAKVPKAKKDRRKKPSIEP